MSKDKKTAAATLQFPFKDGVLPGPLEVAAYAATADAVMNQRRFEELGRPVLILRFHCGAGKGTDRLAYCLTDIPASDPIRICGHTPSDCRQIEIGFRVGMVEEWFWPAVAVVADIDTAVKWVRGETDGGVIVHMWDWSLSNDRLVERFIDFDGNRSKTPVFRQLHTDKKVRKTVKPDRPQSPAATADPPAAPVEG